MMKPTDEQVNVYGVPLAEQCIRWAQNHQGMITAMQLRTAIATIFGPEVDAALAAKYRAPTEASNEG